jgi:hypothetical protein
MMLWGIDTLLPCNQSTICPLYGIAIATTPNFIHDTTGTEMSLAIQSNNRGSDHMINHNRIRSSRPIFDSMIESHKKTGLRCSELNL